MRARCVARRTGGAACQSDANRSGLCPAHSLQESPGATIAARDAERGPSSAPAVAPILAQPADESAAPVIAEERCRFEAVVGDAFARLEAGRAVYGPFYAPADPRDLHREAEEELLDAIVYAYLAILKLRSARAARPERSTE